MIVIDDNRYIHMNRGDRGTIHLSIDKTDGTKYKFQPTDTIRFTVKEKYSDVVPLIRKDITVPEETETIDITLSKSDTTLGGLINRPKKYVYDIALNEDDTVVGYNYDTGIKYFILYPEGSNDE